MTIDTSRRPRYIQSMFGISGEHLLILGIVLLIFGPRRLPELGNTLGKAIRNFKDAISGVEEAQFRRIDKESKDGATPLKTDPTATAQTAAPAAEKVAETADSGTPKNS
jgi:sec-independent protein translocase protein TatA